MIGRLNTEEEEVNYGEEACTSWRQALLWENYTAFLCRILPQPTTIKQADSDSHYKENQLSKKYWA